MNLSLLPLYRFWIQAALTFIILVFSLFNLSSSSRNAIRNQNLYSNLVFFIIGFWLPSPGNQIKRDGQIVEHSEHTNIYPIEGNKK